MPQEHGVGEPVAGPAAGQPASGGAPHLAGPRRYGRVRQTEPYGAAGGEGRGRRGGPVHGLGEVREEPVHGAGGVGDLLGEGLQADDLPGLRRTGGRELRGPCEVAGETGVHQVRGDAGGAQQPPGDLGHAEFAAAGQVAGGRAVRVEPQQRGAPAAYRETVPGVEERRAGGG